MPKSRAGRRRTNALRSRTPRPDVAEPGADSPARRPTQDSRPLLDRILDIPHLAHVIPRLQPEVLHRVIQTCGLEDCSELVALATSEQLARVFDLDLWRAGQPGCDEAFDADRFGVWLEVLMEAGASVAAQKLSEMDVDLVITAVAQHARVFDPVAVAAPVSEDGGETRAVRGPDDSHDVGGYVVVARRTGSWDAIIAVLGALEAEHQDCFHRVMRGCRTLSNGAPEIDGLDDLLSDRNQVRFDVAVDRERRREKQGYVTPAQARAFLEMSRQLRLGPDTPPPANPVARAYFRAIEWATGADASSGSKRLPEASGAPTAPQSPAEGAAAIIDVLVEAGLLTQPPRALLDDPHGQAARLARIQTHMQFAREHDDGAYSMRSQELAYLGNAIVAGCSIQGRPFTAQEASDAAVAICNLGLENWPPHWIQADPSRASSTGEAGTALPDAFLVGHDLVTVFQVGWTALHDQVCMYAAEQLVAVLSRLRCDDREIRTELNALRIEMARHCQAGAPWRACDALDVIAILDMPAWATLLGLIGECPVMHAGIGASRDSRARTVSASDFEFISENSQISSIHQFLQSLPETLRG
jgi:hypothetical protein